MLNELSHESKQRINVNIMIWFTMLGAQFFYLFLCYFLLEEGSYKAILDPKLLNKSIFMDINIHTLIYLVSFIILAGGYLYFNKSYSRIVLETQEANFKNIEEEFKYFNQKYITLMFISLAIFEIIAILGIIIFLTTLNLTISINLIVISILGFLLVIPTKSKFNYERVR